MSAAPGQSAQSLGDSVVIREIAEEDLEAVVGLDERVTGLGKTDYWRDIYTRYTTRLTKQRFFLIAEPAGDEAGKPVLGYIVGEIRAWEFGSSPCGWIFAFSVDPETRLQGVGEQLFEAISRKFRATGISKMRTMVGRSNQLHMAFFRSEGMTAGPYIQLEMEIEDMNSLPS